MVTELSFALNLCKSIREDYSYSLGEKKGSFLINRQQCVLLSNKLLETEKTLKTIQGKLFLEATTSSEFPNLVLATQQLVHVLMLAHTIWDDYFCNGNQWMESALSQGGDLKETFAEILYDLQWYIMVLHNIFLMWTFRDSWTSASSHLQSGNCDGKLSEHDNHNLLAAAEQDCEYLKGLLQDQKGDHACHGEGCTAMHINVQCLATQLLNKMEFKEQFQAQPTLDKRNFQKDLCEVNGRKLSTWPLVVMANKQDLKKGHLLGQGSYGSVHEAEWLGKSYAMKSPKYPSTESLKREIAALAGVHHPHIVGLVCCAEDERNSVYIMERMDKQLSQMLGEDSHLSLIGCVDLMLQIAKGINYLHSMGLVHRDLKPDNILIKWYGLGFESSMLDPMVIAKISDFGTTKLKMDSTAYTNQTMNLGTTMFMAPEMYTVEDADKRPERFHPKKTDVYSFGLICFAVLIWKPTPFPCEEMMNPSVTVFKDRVRGGWRPELPPTCPSHLSDLIKKCWDGNPDERPNFQVICTKLRCIKGLLLTEGSSPGVGNLLVSTVATSSSGSGMEQSEVPIHGLEGYVSSPAREQRCRSNYKEPEEEILEIVPNKDISHHSQPDRKPKAFWKAISIFHR